MSRTPDKPGPEGHDEVTIHLAILEALADGVDPMSGEPLPGESVFRSEGGLAALREEQVRIECRGSLPPVQDEDLLLRDSGCCLESEK